MILWLTRITTNLQKPPPKYPNNKQIPWNYTWVVLSERNDVVWATSKTSTNIWWPRQPYPHLCRSAQGVVAPWGLEYQLDLYKAPEDNVSTPRVIILTISGFQFISQSNLTVIILSGKPYFKIQIFMFAQGTIVAELSIISAVAKLILLCQLWL